MEKIAILLLLVVSGLSEKNKEESRNAKQLFYSPFLFPGNYQAGYPSTNLSPLSFWSNLQSVPALRNSNVNGQPGLQLTSQVPATGPQPSLQFLALTPQQINAFQSTGSQQPNEPLAYSRVHHGNIWNFDDSTNRDDASPKRDALSYFFPFANPSFGSSLDKSYPSSSSHNEPTGFQRGNIESIPTHQPHQSRYSGDEDRVLGNSGGFVRGHVESPP
ncbi:unnamed protein product, partial [Allacma fusca]